MRFQPGALGVLLLAGCASPPPQPRGQPPVRVQCPETISPTVNVVASTNTPGPISLPVGADLLLSTVAGPQALPSGSPLCLARPTPNDDGLSTPRTYVYRAITPGTAYLQLDTGDDGESVPVTVHPPLLRSAPPGPAVTVTIASVSSPVHLHVGEDLNVALAAEFHPPAAADPGVLGAVASAGGYPSNAPVNAVFVALKPGRTAVTTVSDNVCLHATPACMIPQQQVTLRVVVVG